MLRPGLRQVGSLVGWLSRQAKTLAGAEWNDELKREKRRKRRETNLRLKEWIHHHDAFFAGSSIGGKGGQRKAQEEEQEPSHAQLWEQVARSARSRAEQQRILKAWRKWEKASSAQHQQQGQQSWGPEFSWSFRAEFFWSGGGQGAARGGGGRRARNCTFSWEDLFGGQGEEEEAGWWAGARQQQHHHQQQRRRQQQSGLGAGGCQLSSEVRNSLRALGLEEQEGAALTVSALKDAFRRTALRWHPDRHPEAGSKARAEVRFKEAQAAFQLLTTMVVP